MRGFSVWSWLLGRASRRPGPTPGAAVVGQAVVGTAVAG
jgi:hypothetical protein